MLDTFILWLARRIHRRLAKCDAAPGLGLATWHLVLAVPFVIIVAAVAMLRPSLQQKLAKQSPSALNAQPTT